MRHYVITYPEISESDHRVIQDHRKLHDYLYPVIDPHFTLVFGTEMSTEDFVAEAEKQSLNQAPVNFSLRCAVVNKDSFSESYFTFLVPDEGFSGIVKLHDKFYADELFGFLRLDIDYIPHIEIAKSADKLVCKKLADAWNETGRSIHGRISTLEIVTFENMILQTVMTLPLAPNGSL
jgi:hypothetical protein